MTLFKSPLAQLILAFLTIYVGLSWTGFIPGAASTSLPFGLIFVAFGVYGVIKSLRLLIQGQTVARELTEDEQNYVVSLLEAQDPGAALKFIRLKSGANLHEARTKLASLEKGPKGSLET